MLKIFKYLKPFKTRIIFSIFLIFIISAFQCYIPIFEGKVLDIINSKNHDNIETYNSKINKILILNFLFYFLCAVGKFIYNKFLITSIHTGIKNMRQDIYAKINRLPIHYFDQNTVGDIMNKMTNNVDIISNGLQQTFASIIYSFFHITMLFIYMLYINLSFGLVISLMIPFSFMVIFVINKKSRHIFIQRFDKTSEYNGFLQEKFNGQKEIILYNQQENVFKEFQNINQDLSKMIFKSNFVSSLAIPIVNSFTYIIQTIVIILGYFLISPDPNNANIPNLLKNLGFVAIQLGMFEAFIQFVWRLGNPINDLSHFFVITQSTKAAIKKVFDFLYEDEEKDFNQKDLSLNKIEGAVTFSNVSFGYSKDKPIIKNINLNIHKNQKVAIVGSTGSGKTTLINLLTRFYEIDEGSITIDGIDIRDFNKKYLRQILGLVLQDVWLFKGTILENIKYGSEDKTDEEVIEIAKQTKIHDFIMFKDKGYQTIINEELDNLSQGEKQLITITRTLLRDPSILILDEATSTIDTQMEIICQKSIQKLCANKTSFVIAHRLSTIVNSDVIVVLKSGFIIEQGKHEELLELKGVYHSLYHSQFQQ
ncbi:MAG: ABC transporter ATP-binding protein [Phytoplasma sp.]|uniref:ABC transporter ATP-binding protein n=1 Tax=Phytoplasma sp. TaxID=2155 RepID=UPI002B406E01|nr:ABC transporter ATP-binding protein [Phytoplasma sp.]WRH06798.1 MAG: ABC transporter ATP-binding protein [Phytoplasma sp.]